MDKTTITKEEVIAEYLAGGISFIKLGKKLTRAAMSQQIKMKFRAG